MLERKVESDLRQLGAMLLVIRNDGAIWVMEDEKKKEEAAGAWHVGFERAGEMALNVPAGGRNGYETAERTLLAETLEETGIELPLATQFERIHPHHFIVDQLKENVLKRLAVGAFALQVRQGEDIEQKFSALSTGKWMSRAELRQAFQDSGKTHRYRPQLLVAAAMASGLFDVETLQYLNEQLVVEDNELAQEHNWEVHRGVVNNDGRVTAAEALVFLGLCE